MGWKGNAQIDIRKFLDDEKFKGEPEICATFGCGKKLTLYERLWGSHCTEHLHELTTLDIVDRYLND